MNLSRSYIHSLTLRSGHILYYSGAMNVIWVYNLKYLIQNIAILTML